MKGFCLLHLCFCSSVSA